MSKRKPPRPPERRDKRALTTPQMLVELERVPTWTLFANTNGHDEEDTDLFIVGKLPEDIVGCYMQIIAPIRRARPGRVMIVNIVPDRETFGALIAAMRHLIMYPYWIPFDPQRALVGMRENLANFTKEYRDRGYDLSGPYEVLIHEPKRAVGIAFSAAESDAIASYIETLEPPAVDRGMRIVEVEYDGGWHGHETYYAGD